MASYGGDYSSRLDSSVDYNSGNFNSGSDKFANFNSGTSASTSDDNATAAKNHAAGLAESAKNSAASAINSVQNTQIAQDLANGPAAQSVKKEAAATGDEFSALAGSRKVPEYKAANDTPLTHYHNFFFNLLSWKHPRATAISFGSIVAFIFASRYLPISRLLLKLTWMTLGTISLVEIATKLIFSSSATASIRPRRYFKIPKESLEATLDDVEQLINFFVIEIQRIIFAENIANTGIAFFATFLSYYLVKLLPAWGFALFSTSVIFLVPLVYTSNKELIDSQYEHVTNVVGQQTAQLRDLTAEHTSRGFETVKQYTGEYTSVASEYIGKSRQKIPNITPATNGSTSSASGSGVRANDLPEVPKTDFEFASEQTRPIGTAPVNNEPVLLHLNRE